MQMVLKHVLQARTVVVIVVCEGVRQVDVTASIPRAETRKTATPHIPCLLVFWKEIPPGVLDLQRVFVMHIWWLLCILYVDDGFGFGAAL